MKYCPEILHGKTPTIIVYIGAGILSMMGVYAILFFIGVLSSAAGFNMVRFTLDKTDPCPTHLIACPFQGFVVLIVSIIGLGFILFVISLPYYFCIAPYNEWKKRQEIETKPLISVIPS